MVKVARQTSNKTHRAIFQQEGSYDLTSIFQETSQDTNLLNVKIYEVQEAWTGCWGLRAANCAAKASQRDILFSCVVMPTELPNIMGLKGIHSPKALHWQDSCSYCPWCGKEGQNEGTIMNHLRAIHYHMCLVCTLCMEFFTTSADTLRWHVHACKFMATDDKDQEEEEESKNEDDGYLLEEILS